MTNIEWVNKLPFKDTGYLIENEFLKFTVTDELVRLNHDNIYYNPSEGKTIIVKT